MTLADPMTRARISTMGCVNGGERTVDQLIESPKRVSIKNLDGTLPTDPVQ